MNGTAYDVVDRLKDQGIPFLVIGGIVAIIYGVERATFDIDLAVPRDKGIVRSIIDILCESGFTHIHDPATREYRGEIDDLSIEDYMAMDSWRFKRGNNELMVDILLTDYGVLLSMKDREIYAEKDGHRFPIPTRVDIAKYKAIAGRPKDFEDIRELLRLLTMDELEALVEFGNTKAWALAPAFLDLFTHELRSRS